MLEKTKNFTRKGAEKLEKAAASMLAVGAAAGLVPTVYATATEGTENTMNQVMGNVLNVVFTVFKYIGVVLALWGAGALIMAFKNEDADSKSRAIMSLVVGVALVALKSLFSTLLSTLGVTVA